MNSRCRMPSYSVEPMAIEAARGNTTIAQRATLNSASARRANGTADSRAPARTTGGVEINNHHGA
jgi:hypothetical protein